MTNISFNYYEAPSKNHWQGRSGPHDDKRLHQVVELIDLNTMHLTSIKQSSLIIIGFCCDEGVKRNLGRQGAAKGPMELRKQLAKLPYLGNLSLLDVGNIHCVNDDLELAQNELAKLINFCHQQGHKTLVFGGGHETAWGHYLGLKPHYTSLGCFNFDAHFDLRTHHQSTSGTPFLQIATDCRASQRAFNYFCYGIQKTANTSDLYRKANELNVSFIEAEKISLMHVNDFQQNVKQFIEKVDALYLSICMDVFNGSLAPGVSATAPLGLMPWHVFPVLNQLINSKKVISIDIVELAPKLDRDSLTALLASSVAAEVIYSLNIDN